MLAMPSGDGTVLTSVLRDGNMLADELAKQAARRFSREGARESNISIHHLITIIHRGLSQ